MRDGAGACAYGKAMAAIRPFPPSDRRRWLPFAATMVGIALFSLMDALMKRASIATGVYPALFARAVAGAVVLAPLWRRVTGGAMPGRAALRLHLLRGVIVTGMAGTFFYGIVRTPLAEGIALSFIAPLIALGLARVLLGEAIRRAAVVAALIGLAGVIVLAWGRLGQAPPGPDALAGLVAILISAALYGWNLILQRQQAQLASPIEVALSQNIVIAMVLLLGAPAVAAGTDLLAGLPATQDPRALLLPRAAALPDILGGAVLSSISLMLLSWAYARAETQALVPLEYTAFLWAAAMGWWWFGEVVTGWTLAGLVLILAGVWWGTRPPARHD